MHIKDWVTSFWSVHRYTGALLPFEKRLNEFLAICTYFCFHLHRGPILQHPRLRSGGCIFCWVHRIYSVEVPQGKGFRTYQGLSIKFTLDRGSNDRHVQFKYPCEPLHHPHIMGNWRSILVLDNNYRNMIKPNNINARLAHFDGNKIITG